MTNKEKKTVLIVDDQPSTVHSLAEALKNNYKVLIATNGNDALELAKKEDNKPDIILLDVKMPVMNGYDVCTQLHKNPKTKKIPVIFVTIVDEPKLEAHGLSIGAVDYILKPFNLDIVMARVETHLELKAYRDDLEKQVEERTQEVIERQKEVEALNIEITETQKEIIFTLGDVVETRSKETANHVKRVSEYVSLLAQLNGFGEDEIKILQAAAPMHDVGKIGITEAILNKPGELTDEERKIINTHAEIGFAILNNSKRKILKAAAIIAHEHHERWDGLGYPQGLAGEAINIYGRIAAVADVFDALATVRCYKPAWKRDRIIREFKNQRGKQFDPMLTDLFLENINDFYAILEKFPEQN